MILRVLGILAVTSVVFGQRPDWFDECEGFGCGATNSYNKQSCVVSQLTESALSNCVQQSNTHTTFAVSGTINLSSRLDCASNIIIDGSGQNIRLTGEALRPYSNSIIHRITFAGGADDGIKMNSADQDVWIHRCSFTSYGDGLIDITNGFQDVTVSWCRFTDHNAGMLVSSNIDDTDTDRITLHHNYWNAVNQRQPRVRYAHVHIYNNVFEEWGSWAVGSSQRARVLSENNYFSSSNRPDRNFIIQAGEDPDEGYLRSTGCMFGSGSENVENSPGMVPDVSYNYDLDSANNNMVNDVRNNAGNLVGDGPAWFAECEGFGCAPTLSYDKVPCVVSSLSESAVRDCLETPGTHTTFTVSGTIELSDKINCADDIIVDGSGQHITFTGDAIRPYNNAIFYRLSFDTGHDDAIKMNTADKNVWVHRCSFRAYLDGLIDITNGFQYVTVSWCRFQDHDKTMLISSNVDDTDTDKVTLHHNYWVDCRQRLPRVRHAHVHVYNSVHEEWNNYAIGSSQFARVLSENNYFSSNTNSDRNFRIQNGDDPDEGYLRSTGSMFDNGSVNLENSPGRVPDVNYNYNLEKASNSMVNNVRDNAGNGDFSS